ncbi:glycosyltransferase family 4 protein [Pseudoalteromonas sp. S1688]|uniref:glycosyltransferase family 4 protein n=1 Tax=Pseudoalteromonas sp. S1688 TaxID=579511 RepID=UPI00110BDE2D|nr:glycosyltransferase family 4 protein [Pseudoalteromonas sp. S1688]TMP47580.1 hypothetical protein CWB81_17865 [Pseudoalteromonas sp. S1688]
MKKIAYFLSYDLSKEDGVAKKVRNQIAQWRAIGKDVRVYCIGKKPLSHSENEFYYDVSNNIVKRLVKNKKLITDIISFAPDMIYFRYESWSHTFDYLSRKFLVISEVNSLDLTESLLIYKKSKSVKSLIVYLLYYFLRGRVLSRSFALVSVTRELMNHNDFAPYFSDERKCYIPNGVDLNNYNVLKSNKAGEKISLFFIGSPNQQWHGVEYIEKLALSLPEYDFHIVGINNENKENLFFYGFLSKAEYQKILSRCHICIGTLALFKNAMEEACPLKVREYLLHGFPVILGYQDTAFIDYESLPSWLLHVDVRSLGFPDQEQINNFIIKNIHTVVQDSELTELANDYLETKRIDFFDKFSK